MANSAATITMPEAHLDMVRPGLALYGYWPARHMAGRIDLRPILRLVSHVTLIKELPVGHCVGYGQTFTTIRPTRLGMVPVGYFDGYVRALSNAAQVTINSRPAPVIGRVSMDQLAVDLTDIPGARLGSEVTLIDNRPEQPNSVAAIAERLGTIPYEVTCLLGQRIQRISVGNSCPAAPRNA
jgi:alanine racemase